MMIPVVKEDVVQALATAQNIYKIAFQNTDTATSQLSPLMVEELLIASDPSYKEFGEDIRKFAINLDLLLDVLKKAEYQAGPSDKARQDVGLSTEYQVLGGFKTTLDDCEILLSDQKFFQRSGGFVKNLCWYSKIEPEIHNLRRRIACHNIKFSIVFKILDPQVLEDRSIHIVNSMTYILDCAERLGQFVHREKGHNALLEQDNVAIPSELENAFMRIAWQLQTDRLSLDCGLDAAIQYFDGITRLADDVVQDESIYYVAITNIMHSVWIIRSVRGSQEYQIAASFPSNTTFSRQMGYWGVTIERFFAFFEKALQEALHRILGPHLILPPTTELLAILERQRPISPNTDQTKHLRRAQQSQQVTQFPPKQKSPVEMEDTSRLNRAVELPVESSLWEDRTVGQETHQISRPQQSPSLQRSPNLRQSPKLQQSPQLQQSPRFNQFEPYPQKQQTPVEMEDTSIASWDVERVHRDVRGRRMSLKSPDPKYTQTLQIHKQTDSHSSLVLTLTPLSEGTEKETTENYELDKVQIIPSYAMRTWTAPSLEPQTIIFRTDHISPLYRRLVFQQKQDMFEFQQKITGYRVGHDDARVLVTSQESTLLSGLTRQDLCRLQLWHAQTPTPEDNLALLSPRSPPVSTAPGSKRISWSSTSTSSISSSRSIKKLTPSIFSMRSSSSRRSSVTVDPPSYVTPKSSTVAVYTAPIAPCLVLFAHKAPTIAERVEERDALRSFLVIEIDPEITIEEELNEQEEIDPTSHRCVLEKKSSYLQARRTLETSNPALWDLAAVGLYQREAETEVVKKLKHVILEFDTRINLTQFITKSNLLKAFAKKELAKFIQATGERK